MMLTIGTKRGPYEILGVVARAGWDVQRHGALLGYDVALKILPETFASDAKCMSRFEREAKVLASQRLRQGSPDDELLEGSAPLEQFHHHELLAFELVNVLLNPPDLASANLRGVCGS